MVKDGKIFAVFLTLFMLVVFLHTLFYVVVFGTGISGVAEKGISGIIIGGNRDFRDELGDLFFSPGEEKPSFPIAVLLLEWIGLIILASVFYFKKKAKAHKEIESIDLGRARKKSGTDTDIDNVYAVLKEKKNLRVSTLSKVYGVEKEVIMSWGKILESSNLISVEYPFFGEPRFVLANSGGSEK